MSILQSAIENFENNSDLSPITEERKISLDQVYINKDTEELIAVRSIGNEEHNGVVLAGVDNEGVYTAIMLSFVKKEGAYALQVITMSPKFRPDENLAFGLTLSNDEKLLFNFIHKMVPVEGTDYYANFRALTEEQMAKFIEYDIVHWQFLQQQTNDILTSDMNAEADTILPAPETQYLIRRIAYGIATFDQQ